MENVPNCVLKYIINMLQSNDKFNLVMVNKRFRKIIKFDIKFNIQDFQYMVKNKYKMVYHSIIYLNGANLYYIYCANCKQSHIDFTYEKCDECKTILCKNCILSCEYCNTSINLCQSCALYKFHNDSIILMSIWCGTCKKSCYTCNDDIISMYGLKNCTNCNTDLCNDCYYKYNTYCYYCINTIKK